MNILVVGDIFGKPGRKAVKELLPAIVERDAVDFVIANVENVSGGKGVTPKAVDELFKSPIDVMTAGNHVWEFDDIRPYFNIRNILRPLNMKDELPGRGWAVFERKGVKVCVICLQGEIFMEDKGPKVVNPFKIIDGLLGVISANIIIVDFHAEATSEKRAMGWFLDGRVSALLGTHTHIQTADEEILPKGTAYISDIGMTGPHDSVIGLKKEKAIKRFLEGDKKGFKVAEGGIRLEGVILTINDESRKIVAIRRIREPL